MLPNFRKSETDPSKALTSQMSDVQGFSAQSFQNRPSQAVARADDRPTVSVIGADLTIAGNLISKGEVQVEGIVEGDIHGSHVVVAESATITGGIVADEVVVRGHVVGTVRGKRVMLQSTSQVEGDIYHQSLSIEQGAMFEGKSRRTTDDPRTMVIKNDTSLLSMPPRIPELAN